MKLYTTTEASTYLGVHPESVRSYILGQKLHATKKGKTWLIEEADLEEFKNSDWFVSGRHFRPGRPYYGQFNQAKPESESET